MIPLISLKILTRSSSPSHDRSIAFTSPKSILDTHPSPKMFCLRRYCSNPPRQIQKPHRPQLTISLSWLPLLFIPTNASPLFIISFITLTYLLHRPCIYCSALLLILFLSSCHWSDRCFFDFRGDWFSPRFSSSSSYSGVAPTNASSTTTSIYSTTQPPQTSSCDAGLAEYVLETVNSTTATLATAAFEEAKRRFTPEASATSSQAEEWTGIGLEWLRSLLGKREWVLPCIDVKVRL